MNNELNKLGSRFANKKNDELLKQLVNKYIDMLNLIVCEYRINVINELEELNAYLRELGKIVKVDKVYVDGSIDKWHIDDLSNDINSMKREEE